MKLRLSRMQIMLIVISAIPVILLIIIFGIITFFTWLIDQSFSFVLANLLVLSRMISNINVTDKNFMQCIDHIVEFKSSHHAVTIKGQIVDHKQQFKVIKVREVNDEKLFDLSSMNQPDDEVITVSINNVIVKP